MPNSVGCFPLPQIFSGCFWAVKYMYNTIAQVCFSQLERTIYGMYVFKKNPTFLGACWVNQTQPHQPNEEKTVCYSEANILILEAQLTWWK